MKKCILLLILMSSTGLLAQSFSNDNYIYSVAPRKAVTADQYKSLTAADIKQNVIYYDGLGRPIQNIEIGQGGGPNGLNIDVVTPMEYDAIGRQEKEYLSYPFTNVGNANLKAGSPVAVQSYYTTKFPADIVSPSYNAFSQKEFDSSPLNRITKQAAPGNDWRKGSGHEIKIEYKTNVANEVKLYLVSVTFANNTYTPTLSVSTANGGFYAANELTKTVTYDENSTTPLTEVNGSTSEYRNKEGQIVLKRTYGIAGTNLTNEAHDTYFIYDKFGNLSYILPPLFSNITTQLNDLAFQYKYDYRNRLVEKKLPGKQWEYIIYDKLDRIVATGPVQSPFPNLTSLGWMITKYDVFDRPIITGWMPAASITSADRANLQSARNSETVNISESKSAALSSVNDVNFRYSNVVWPTNLTVPAPTTVYHILSVNYYDDYDYPGAPTTFTPVAGQNVYYNLTVKPQGLLTGSWVRVLESTAITPVKFQKSYSLYDDKARGIRNYTSNFLEGYDQVDTNFDFLGKPVYDITTHQRILGGPLLPLLRNDYVYSSQDRLLSIKQTISGVTQLIASNTYDELGNLVSKKVGNTELNPLQIVNYSYNIRGWLNGINNVNQLSNGSDPKDLFALQIKFNDIADVSKKMFNGNISQTLWSSDNTDKAIRNYVYTYDALNRIKSATDNVGFFNEDNILYDKNGNILKLKRKGAIVDMPSIINPANFGLMDDLTYSYNTGNRLVKVADAATIDSYGFKDDALNTVADTADDYTYDADGNMLTDANRGITTNITYNHLNLPTKIVFPSGNNISYLYNALGKKLQKVVTVVLPSSITTTEYLGAFQYKKINSGSTDLQFFPTSEGYVANNAGVYSYVFQYRDHLGNIRLSYAKNPSSGLLDIIEENNYYPFGLEQQGYNNAPKLTYGNVFAEKYKYNGKELQDELGLNMYDYGARNYDPALGRFMNVDPLAEISTRWSPYTYTYNNPVLFIDVDGLYVDTSWIYRKNKNGTYVNKNIVEAFEAFAKSKEGISFLSDFAEKDQVIAGHKYSESGKYDKKDIDLNYAEANSEDSTGDAYTTSETKGKKGLQITTHLYGTATHVPTLIDDIGHEAFLHVEPIGKDFYDDKKLNLSTVDKDIVKKLDDENYQKKWRENAAHHMLDMRYKILDQKVVPILRNYYNSKNIKKTDAQIRKERPRGY